MKGKKYRVVAAALCAAFLLCGITTTAYAGGGEEWEDGTGGPEWEGLDPVEPTPAPEPEPEKSGGAGTLLLVLAVLALGGGAGWYFKIYRPKLQKAAEPAEDCGGEPYDGPEDYDGEALWDEDDGEPEE